jgi:Flp pilus assembly protein TadG
MLISSSGFHASHGLTMHRVLPTPKMIRRVHSKRKGQATIEFLLSAIFLFTIISAAIQFIVMMYMYVLMSHAAKQGVRYAIVHGSKSFSSSGPGMNCTCTTVKDAVKNYANYSGMTITVNYLDGNNDPPSQVQVQLSYAFSLFHLGFTGPTMRASAQGRIAY